jgi:hypothetical protein
LLGLAAVAAVAMSSKVEPLLVRLVEETAQQTTEPLELQTLVVVVAALAKLANRGLAATVVLVL